MLKREVIDNISSMTIRSFVAIEESVELEAVKFELAVEVSFQVQEIFYVR